MNHLEVHLMLLSRLVDSGVLRMTIQFECFFLIQGNITNVIVEILDVFLFGVSLDIKCLCFYK